MSSTLTPKNRGEEIALFRSEIVGPLARREFAHGALSAALEELSAQRFRPPGRDHSCTFAVSTLERWLYRYKKGGLSALIPKPRSDQGHGQGLTPEQGELLCDIRREHPTASAELIQRTLVLQGQLDRKALSPATLRRFYKDKGLDPASLRLPSQGKQRLRWEAERPGALWHGDVCHGPCLEAEGTTRPLRIHAMLDDASRYIVAIEAHHSETEVDMLGLLCRALQRQAPPEALYLDNGSTYRGEALRLGCERMGITLLHARPYDAPARGKMERFVRQDKPGKGESGAHTETFQEDRAGRKPSPAKVGHQPVPSVAWSEGNLGCEAYTGSARAA